MEEKIKIKRPKPKEKDLPKRDRGERKKKFKEVTNRTIGAWRNRWKFYQMGTGKIIKRFCPKCKANTGKYYIKNHKLYCEYCNTEAIENEISNI